MPLLMRLLYEEADSMAVPDMLHGIMEAIRSHLAAGAVGSAAAAGETAGTACAAGSGGITSSALSEPSNRLLDTNGDAVLFDNIQ